MTDTQLTPWGVATAEELLARGQQALANQSFSVLMGAQLVALSPGHTELLIPLRPDFYQHHGFAHGGVVGYVADTALGFVGGAVLGPNAVSAEYKINFVQPARGEKLIARSTVIAAGKRQAICRCDVFAVDGANEYLCATAQGTIVKRGKDDL